MVTVYENEFRLPHVYYQVKSLSKRKFSGIIMLKASELFCSIFFFLNRLSKQADTFSSVLTPFQQRLQVN